MRKRLKKITTKKITINGKPRRILGIENTSTFVPYAGMVKKQVETDIII